MKSCICLLFIIISTQFSFKTNAQTVIAQSTSSIGDYNWENIFDSFEGMVVNNTYGQTFKSLVTTTISEINFYIYTVSSAGTYDIEIYSCPSTTSWGTLLNSKTNISLSATGWVSVDVSALNISVTAGNYYGFRLVPQFGLSAGLGADNDVYADGHSWTSYDNFGEATDITFKAISNAVLPVQLTSFTAQKQNDHVLLQWSTASEQNAKNFTVQHSMDGSNWNTIGIVTATGNSNTIVNYSYTDNDPATGINYYRLKETDIDGKTTLSETKVVKFSNKDKIFSILSNPVSNGELKLQVNEAAQFSLYDPTGRLFWKGQLMQGTQTVDVNNYAKGIYLLKAKGITEKVIIQ